MYGLINNTRARPGHRDEIVDALVTGSERLLAAGCLQSTVGTDEGDEDAIWVFEVWKDESARDTSLDLPEARAAIAKAMSLLTRDFTRVAMSVKGGRGLRRALV